MSSSSSTISGTTVNGRTVYSGLSSNIDVDSTVKKMISADSGYLNQLKQKKQKDEWKQEQYQTIINDIQTFSDKYLNLTSSDSILKQSNYIQYSVSSDNTAVLATASAKATQGSHTITVSQLATAGKQTSSADMTQVVTGSSTPDYSSLQGTSFTIEVDGTKRTVSFDSAYDSSSQTGAQYVQTAINKAVGTTTDSNGNTINKVTVSEDSNGYLQFTPTDDSGVDSITISDASSDGSFSSLGFSSSSNTSNRISTSDTLETVAGKLKSAFSFDSTSGEIEFSINGESFSFDKSDTLSEMISTINNDSKANVTMKYDSNTDQLVLTANSTGAGSTISVSDTSGTFVSSVLTNWTEGKDSQVVLDGEKLTRSSNTITQDGITYTLNKTTTSTTNISVTNDVDGIYDTIKSFVDDYNTLIDEINDKLDEKYDTDYQPLTDSQEEDMSDTEISNWNTKAQTGLLHNDSKLSSMLNKIRNALTSSVSGVTETLSKIGITTSDYSEKGKLHIDEDTLKSAISNDPNGVMNLFSQQSSSYPGLSSVRSLNSSQRATRTNEEGIAYKLYDILQDNISTIKDKSGSRGCLIEAAGTKDGSDSTNALSKELDTLADKIDAEQDRLDKEEDRYYTEFTNMETALEKMSSQYNAISSLTSSSSSS
ncbi:MAG TPA: flagellar filament capping protein FliD [Syntrophomonadaceae bacterium]|nr:flagellar filament capping protein FliD [Syntrophomonadaceae bacterium]